MHSRALTLMLSGAIGLLVTGCTSTTPTFRGQSPNVSQAAWGGPVEHVHHSGHAYPCPDGHCHPGHVGRPGHVGHGQRCPHGACRCAPGTGCNLPFNPVHRNFHTYRAPQGLMYPPENATPAMYQYPYYTLRGPTDFFMQ